MENFKDRVVFVTGAGSGIGKGCAKRFAEHGSKVVVADIDKVLFANTVQEIYEAGGEAIGVPLDVSCEKNWQQAITNAVEEFGRLDILVNSAGVGLDADLEKMSIEQWRRVLGINLEGVFFGCKFAIEYLKKSDSGAIINMSSIAAERPGSRGLVYSTTKRGVLSISESVGIMCAKKGYKVRCNSILPGPIDTPLLRETIDNSRDPERTEQHLAQMSPMGRLGKVDDIVNVCLFLASNEASFVNSASIVVDGGYIPMP